MTFLLAYQQSISHGNAKVYLDDRAEICPHPRVQRLRPTGHKRCCFLQVKSNPEKKEQNKMTPGLFLKTAASDSKLAFF